MFTSSTDNFVFCTGPEDRPRNCARLVGSFGKAPAELAGDEAAEATRHLEGAAADFGRSKSYRFWCAGAVKAGRAVEPVGSLGACALEPVDSRGASKL